MINEKRFVELDNEARISFKDWLQNHTLADELRPGNEFDQRWLSEHEFRCQIADDIEPEDLRVFVCMVEPNTTILLFHVVIQTRLIDIFRATQFVFGGPMDLAKSEILAELFNVSSPAVLDGIDQGTLELLKAGVEKWNR